MTSRLVNKQILIIDDDEVLRTLLTRVLTTAGCKVESCSSVKEALLKIDTNSSVPDLIFLDLNMPDADGYSFLKFRRQKNSLFVIPVIVLSGTKKKDEIQLALELGADQFLEKPFEARLILQKMRFIFLTQEDLVFRFPDPLMVDAEIHGDIVEQCLGHLKIESQVRFAPGKSVEIRSEDYIRHQGASFIARVVNRLVEMKEGFFRTVVCPVGMDTEEKNRLEAWQRSSSK